MNLTRNERLAAQVAIADSVGAIAKEAKEEARADLAATAAANDMDKAEYRLEAFGVDCGTVSVKRKQGSIEIRPGQDYSACEYLYQQGLAYPKPVTGWRDRFAIEDGTIIDKETGEDVSRFFEVVDGGYTGRVTVKKDLVLEKLRPMLGESVFLLGGDTNNNTPDYGEEPEVSHV